MLSTLNLGGKSSATNISKASIFPVGLKTRLKKPPPGILCPYLNMLSDYWTPLPLLVYGFFAFSSGLVSLMLPETLNKQLPETIEDGENFDKN
jgi:hypothetical protein